MRSRIWGLFVLVFGLGLTQPVWAQFEFLSRYHKEPEVRKIILDGRKMAGRLDAGMVYLTEREAVEMALVNNLDLNVERHTQLTRDLDIQLQQASYDPRASFAFNWDRQKNPAASVLQGGSSVTDILTTYSFGYTQLFKTGTQFEVTFLGNRNRTTNFFSSLVPAIRTEFQLLFRQDLLKGFWKAAPEYEIEIARNNTTLTEEEFRRLVIETISQVQDRFLELEYIQKEAEVRQKALETAETVLEQNKIRFEVGTSSRLEVVQAEAEVATRKEELIRTDYTYRRIQDQLVRLITDLEDPQEFGGKIVPVFSSREVGGSGGDSESFAQLLSRAVELRPELRQNELNLANQGIRQAQAKDDLRPGLQLVAGYQFFGLGGTQVIRDFSQGFFNPPVVAVIPGGLPDSLSQLASAEFGGYVVGFNLDVPIKNEAAQVRNAQSQIATRRLELQKGALRQAIALEIRDALTQIQMNEARLEATQASVAAARERLAGEEARFEVGMGTTRELIEAQRDLLQAESLQVRAQTDLNKSRTVLDKAIGRTLEKHNIRVEDAMAINVRGSGLN